MPTVRNLPHRIRLRTIESLVRTLDLPEKPSYADFGCGNGYVSEHVRRLIAARKTYGFDQQQEQLERGCSSYPDIQFSRFDLNNPRGSPVRCDLVTCFETLEHVGRLDCAVANLVSAVAPGGTLLISVPIEIGVVGLAKLALKLAYRYDFSELPAMSGLRRRYAWALVTGARMSRFRDGRPRWGTHFGFDHRDLCDALSQFEVDLRRVNSFTTHLCIARVRSSSSNATSSLSEAN